MKQKIYPFEQHHLDQAQVDEHALFVMQKLREAGFIAYLVGGSVRDLLLQKKPKDFDIATSARPEEVKRVFRNCILIGKRFRLAHIRFGRKILEVSTFRSGNVETEELILRDNEWGSAEEDVLRRDFTINGLFYDSETQTIIDYVGGYRDIQRKYLRTIGQPFLRFKQDPVRMIRLLKFQARFGFEIDSEARIALLECRSEIAKSSPARILEELLRMLESRASHSFFKLMNEHGLLQLLLPTLAAFMETSDGDEIYSYLEEVDTTFHDLHLPLLERAILLSCLAFPLLQKRIQTRYLDRERTPHLGEIQQETFHLLDEIFRPFFHIPRRLFYGIASVLISQYRLTPLEKRRSARLRIPNDPDFAFALKFLNIRCCVEPGLQKIWEEWNEAFLSPERPPAKKRRRRKKAKGTSPPPPTTE
ncbi:MAG: polynucleotide adenylyltransferase PcnB [Anaerolineae bacterium]